MTRKQNLVLTDELHQQLKAYIEAQDTPPSTAVVIREALVQFLDERGFPVSEAHPPRGGDRSK